MGGMMSPGLCSDVQFEQDVEVIAYKQKAAPEKLLEAPIYEYDLGMPIKLPSTISISSITASMSMSLGALTVGQPTPHHVPHLPSTNELDVEGYYQGMTDPGRTAPLASWANYEPHNEKKMLGLPRSETCSDYVQEDKAVK
eukprot:gnl/TRDRNA2_/TRDRNA2_175602_c1_seq7.p1 gnl/TRDRNA2_/TRDRNA2_175602_c1~~gnl/TRDRNA2_/TRDRNA2_175602_c1_seq7.p1  ORF type:complete len:141 (-),score=26.22 gnl/TRDRNA2_/TRDRNA2_175602_c1_seq7:557-979(-)